MNRNYHLYFESHDVFFIPSKNNTYLLYAPTIKKLLRVTKKLTERSVSNNLIHCQDQDVNNLIKHLEASLKNEIKPFPMHNRKAKTFHLALGLTKDCTLSCIYCHAEAGKPEEITYDILQAAIKYAFKTAQKNKLKAVNISFAVGGEATTNWNLFKTTVNEIQSIKESYNIPVYLSMTTNGYYGMEKRQFISSNFDNILISIDGPPEIHDIHRPAKDGKDSYSTVIESAHYFGKNVRSFAIRSTISNISVSKMPQIIEFFHGEFGNNYRIVFEPLIPLGRGAELNSDIGSPSQKEFVEYFILAREVSKKLKIDLITSATNHKRLVTSFCGAMSIPSFIVTTKGIVTTCERDIDGSNYWYAKYDPEIQDFRFNEDRKKQNAKLLNMPSKCEHCFCKWHCAGDCPDVRTINYNRCFTNKKLTQYELECILSE